MRALVGYRQRLLKQRLQCQNEAKAVLRRNGYNLGKNQDVCTWLTMRSRILRLREADLAILSSAVDPW
ncbi:MAG TPA: hypothetical protein GXX30_09115 [Firmicutes bacterium]|nr:hypothetical protein [Candidatus Fermentithermobacillaceae bacterium]